MLEIPRFERNTLHSTKLAEELDEAFEALVCEILTPKYPGLQPSEPGKDGGIDLRTPDRTEVFECKQIAAEGLAPARSRWLEVFGRFRKHLSSSDGPTPGQSQYGPWFSTDPPIRRYTFCISSKLANPNQRDELVAEIRAGFADRLSLEREAPVLQPRRALGAGRSRTGPPSTG